MNIVIVEDELIVFAFEIENTDSLLPDRLNIPLSFINTVTAFRTVHYFIDITTTVLSECIILIKGELTIAVWTSTAPEGISVTMFFYLDHSSSHLHFSSIAQH